LQRSNPMIPRCHPLHHWWGLWLEQPFKWLACQLIQLRK
jgi:hypothetical protein